jgi:hypothetical protein
MPMVDKNIPKQASIAAASTCPRCVITTSRIPSRAAKKISRAPNIGATLSKTGAKSISAQIEKTAPKKLAE